MSAGLPARCTVRGAAGLPSAVGGGWQQRPGGGGWKVHVYHIWGFACLVLNQSTAN